MKRLILVFKREIDLEAFIQQLKVGDLKYFKVEDVPVDPKAVAPPVERAPRGRIHREGTPISQTLCAHFGVMKHFWEREANDFAVARGYSNNTVAPTLNALKRAGYVGRRDDGMWYFKQAVPTEFRLHKGASNV